MAASANDHLPSRAKRRPMDSGLVAAARRITNRRISRPGSAGASWSSVAWDRYEQVGELRYSAQHVGRAVSRATLTAAVDPLGAEEPETIQPGETDEDGQAVVLPRASQLAADLIADLGGSAAGQAQLLQRLGVHLFVPGESWIVGYDLMDDAGLVADRVWLVLSPDEVTSDGRMLTINLGDGTKQEVAYDDAVATRVWQPHPRKWWEPDSPTRSALPVLSRLVGLAAHVDAAIDSRLAGAGLLVLPNSVSLASNQDAVEDEDDPEQAADRFILALMDAMVKPLEDRDTAAAYVPLTIRVPDDVVDKVQHLTFSTPLDDQVVVLEERAIQRLAMSLDMPPEVLLGTADSNHWSAWQVSESTVTTHIEPMLALICDALTLGYLRPALEAAGVPEDEAAQYVCWYDVSNLVVRPNVAGDAKDMHAAGALSDEALRRTLGFSEADAPVTADVDQAVALALDLVRNAPSLMQAPGLPTVVANIRAVLDGDTADTATTQPAAEGEAAGPGDAVGPPDTQGDEQTPALNEVE